MTRANSPIVLDHIDIPTLPEIVERINSLVQDPTTGTREIGELVAQDAPLSSKVLRIANSAFYGLRQRVMSTEHAAAVLGVRVLRNLVLQASIMGRFEHLDGHEELDLGLLWRHSVLTAQLCRYLGCDATLDVELQPEELYTCGLLHDLGRLVLLEEVPETYLDLLRRTRTEGRALHDIEREQLGTDHMEVGALLAHRWGLPPGVIKSIRYHHAPAEGLPTDGAVAVVNLANRVAEEVQRGIPAELVDLDGRGERLGLEPDRARAVVEFAHVAWPTIEI